MYKKFGIQYLGLLMHLITVYTELIVYLKSINNTSKDPRSHTFIHLFHFSNIIFSFDAKEKASELQI